MGKSVEQKLFEAFQSGRGVRLSADEVCALVGPDDAIGTRISNAAANKAGIAPDEWPGHDAVPRGNSMGLTWAQFKRYFKRASATEGAAHD